MSIDVRVRNATTSLVEVYVAECLGKIWKLRVPLDSADGTVKPTDMRNHVYGSPELLLDESAFSASVRIREVVAEASSVGVPVYEKIMFEGLQ